MHAEGADIVNLLEEYQRASVQIERQIFDMVYSMDGGISWTEAWEMSPKERNDLISYVNHKIEESERSRKKSTPS